MNFESISAYLQSVKDTNTSDVIIKTDDVNVCFKSDQMEVLDEFLKIFDPVILHVINGVTVSSGFTESLKGVLIVPFNKINHIIINEQPEVVDQPAEVASE